MSDINLTNDSQNAAEGDAQMAAAGAAAQNSASFTGETNASTAPEAAASAAVAAEPGNDASAAAVTENPQPPIVDHTVEEATFDEPQGDQDEAAQAEELPEQLQVNTVAGAPVSAAPAASTAASVATAEPVKVQATAGIENELEVMLEAAMSKVSVSGKLFLQQLQAYIVAMSARRTVNEQDGARYQVGLYRTLTGMINKLDVDFETVFNATLRAIVLEKDRVFHDTQVFRFTEHMSLPQADRRTFVSLLNLLKSMADPRTRMVAARQVDLQKSFGPGITEQGKQRVLGHFNL